jgi:ABC-2 type transport system permease protein
MTAYAEIAVPAPTPRASLWRLAGVELRKMADTRAGFWLIAVTGLIAVAVVVLTLIFGEDADRSLDAMFRGAVWPVSVLLPILGILVVTSEWSQRTALGTFTLVPERERVVAAKFVAGLAFAVIANVVCLELATIGTVIGGAEWNLTFGDVLSATLYQALGMLMGIALGLVLLSSPLAIVLYFVLPTIIAILVETIRAIRSAGEWIDTSRTFEPLLENEMAGGDWARLAVSVALWLGVPLVIGLVRLRRTELK